MVLVQKAPRRGFIAPFLELLGYISFANTMALVLENIGAAIVAYEESMGIPPGVAKIGIT
jgi:predicted RNase H-like HicB family nuclease